MVGLIVHFTSLAFRPSSSMPTFLRAGKRKHVHVITTALYTTYTYVDSLSFDSYLLAIQWWNSDDLRCEPALLV